MVFFSATGSLVTAAQAASLSAAAAVALENTFQDPCPTLQFKAFSVPLNGTRRVTMPQVLTRRRRGPMLPSLMAAAPASSSHSHFSLSHFVTVSMLMMQLSVASLKVPELLDCQWPST